MTTLCGPLPEGLAPLAGIDSVQAALLSGASITDGALPAALIALPAMPALDGALSPAAPVAPVPADAGAVCGCILRVIAEPWPATPPELDVLALPLPAAGDADALVAAMELPPRPLVPLAFVAALEAPALEVLGGLIV